MIAPRVTPSELFYVAGSNSNAVLLGFALEDKVPLYVARAP